MQDFFICLTILALMVSSCSVLPKESINKKQFEAINGIESASLNRANKYALEDINKAIEAYNNGRKYVVQGDDELSGFAYNNFINSIEYAKRAKKKAQFFYTKELIDRNTKLIEKSKTFLEDVSSYESYSIQNYNNLILLSNGNIDLAQKNSFQLFDKMQQISVLDLSRVDDSIIQHYQNKDQIFIEKGKPKIRAQQGETLEEISKTYLGSSRFWREIYQLNRANIPNPNTLRAGQKIILPKLKQ